MRFLDSAIRQLKRLTRAHAILLSIAGVVLLLLGIAFSQIRPLTLGLTGKSPIRNEAALDAALQESATAALRDRDGTIIVMDAQTGRVRAIVNPHVAYEEALMPGSAIKPFTALAALRSGLIDENSRTVCPGRFTGLNFSLACVHADHLPPFSPAQAIAYSCNYYFATAGQRLGREQLVATLRQFDFGQSTGISQDERSGVVRPCEIGSSTRVRTSEPSVAAAQSDCLERAAVGESDHIQVTPIQLLTAYTALVNGGHLFEPGVATSEQFRTVERSTIAIAERHRAIIVDGMRGAVRYGTARTAKLDSLPLTLIGKTGTATPAKGFRTNGWFVGFAAPFQSNGDLEPSQIGIAVLVLSSRAHGSDAAELARPIFETYANAVSRGGVETSTTSRSIAEKTNSSAAITQRSADLKSTIKVHQVRENVTQTLSLEDYVLGVMRAEGAVESEPEALNALAIAIRSYALKNTGRHARDGYDFCSTTHCQRFITRESNLSTEVTNARLEKAERNTEGQVLIDNHGRPIDAYFGASCGGETANIRNLWGVNPVSYLQGVRDEYCNAGPHASWTDAISRADLLRALQSDSRTDVGNRLDHILISKQDETGRAEFITLEGEHRKTVRGWDFKIIVGRVLGWNLLKSSRFDVGRSGSSFIFRGSGFGHGLGLCQEGAHEMARRGASYRKILEKYFPGTVVKRDPHGNDTLTAEFKADVLTGKLDSVVSLIRPISFALLTISSDHFRVFYPDETDRRMVNQVVKTLESTRSDYLRRASGASSVINIPRLDIRLNESTGDFTSRTGQPPWAAAATKGSQIELQPLALLKQRGVLFTTLRHELAHVTIDAVGKRTPRWLSEGFALYLAGEGRTISRYAARRRLTEAELEDRLQHPRTQVEMRTLYAEAYLMVSEIIRRDGEASVWNKVAGN
jgi:stage II sporulation protein D